MWSRDVQHTIEKKWFDDVSHNAIPDTCETPALSSSSNHVTERMVLDSCVTIWSYHVVISAQSRAGCHERYTLNYDPNLVVDDSVSSAKHHSEFRLRKMYWFSSQQAIGSTTFQD